MKQLKEFPKTEIGRPTLYPWDAWFCGKVIELKLGEDFECDPSSLRSAAYQQAKSKGIKVRIAITEDTVTLVAGEGE